MKTMIAIPCMDTVPTLFMTSLMKLKGAGQFHLIIGSLIYNARNELARQAIKEGYDRVLWLDSDMVFEPDLPARLHARIDEGREFVTGLYFARKEPYTPTIYRKMEIRETPDGGKEAVAEVYEEYPESGVFEIQACGFGIVMTTVRLLKDLTAQYGQPFTPVEGFGEDMAFCIRAREAGYPLWCDSGIRAQHLGTALYGEESYKGVWRT